MLAGTHDHLTRLSPVILNLKSTDLTHLESEIRVVDQVLTHCDPGFVRVVNFKVLKLLEIDFGF